MIFERRSKYRIILIAICALVLLAGGIFAWQKYFKGDAEGVMCTMEAKLCPDGSYVSRTGPNCEFAPCPSASPRFSNDQIEKAITDYLLSQKAFSWKTTEGSFNFCSIENLRPGQELFPIYIWAYCAEYTMENGELKTQSGTSLPVKINYPNELSFYDISKFSHEIPRDGSYNGPDIERIFPKDAQQALSSLDKQILIKRNETAASAFFSAWDSIKNAINDCQVKEVFQAHSKEVSVELKDGKKIKGLEPRIDDIIHLAIAVRNKCGRIIMATE